MPVLPNLPKALADWRALTHADRAEAAEMLHLGRRLVTSSVSSWPADVALALLRAAGMPEIVRGVAPWDPPCRSSVIVGATCCFATNGGKTECVNCGRLG